MLVRLPSMFQYEESTIREINNIKDDFLFFVPFSVAFMKLLEF